MRAALEEPRSRNGTRFRRVREPSRSAPRLARRKTKEKSAERNAPRSDSYPHTPNRTCKKQDDALSERNACLEARILDERSGVLRSYAGWRIGDSTTASAG